LTHPSEWFNIRHVITINREDGKMEQIDWSRAPDWADRVVKSPIRLKLFWANNNERRALDDSRFGVDGQHVRDNWEVVERRPITNIVRVDVNIKPTKTWHPIEQRIASLRALEKQVEETRAELTRDLEALGLTWMVQDEPIITDWRDLRVGDVVEITSVHKRTLSDGYGEFIGTEATIVSVGAPELQDLVVTSLNSTLHIDGFRFIRRP
jgi:hypothetical protein